MKITPLKEDHHRDIVALIKKHAGKGTKHTFLNGYLGNDHPRYAISSPVLRKIAAEWMRAHANLTEKEVTRMLTSLIEGESGTEKIMAGILMDYTKSAQRKFDPAIFDHWLDQLEGWAEVDAVCTGKYSITEITAQWKSWKPLIVQLSKSKNINKRRASLVLLTSPVRSHNDENLSALALQVVERLKHEKEILITKAISWLLRNMIKHHRELVQKYLAEQGDTLPSIALRETLVKLKTGVKNNKQR